MHYAARVQLWEVAMLVASVALVALVVVLGVALHRSSLLVADLRAAVRRLDDNTLPVLARLRAATDAVAHAQALVEVEIATLGERAAALDGLVSRLDETASRIARTSADASIAAEHASTLARLVTETVGAPLIRTASTTYALKTALTGRRERRE